MVVVAGREGKGEPASHSFCAEKLEWSSRTMTIACEFNG